jgi:class 3 adenylate cyclase/tetratricopeptide (TPR) repeat protein
MLPRMAACASCGSENPDGARFCSGCAARLESAAASVREERKIVTVLFADLAGFTSRSETLDPEDVRAFLLPYYEVLTSQITRHGGHVDRFLGDGVMALFGAPVAHEDDPERAVRAALRILERIPRLGLDLHVRLGINTGSVLFAAGSGGERDDAVTGDAVNTAARLQALAPMDGVVVGEATYRATTHLFAYDTLEPTLVKGKAEPIGIFRPTAPLAYPAGELHAETTPFVGRDLELALLTGLFERARATPSLELATIVGEPGLGKSRLVRELAWHVEALPELVTWRVGRCLPYGDGISVWALGEIVKGHAGILDTDDQATLAAKLEAVLVEPDPSMRVWMKDRLAPLVGLETSTEPPAQEEAFTAWRRFLEQIAQGGPTVLVVEDLHWADDTLVAFLSHLVDHTAGLPLLLVTTARPELEERHPAWLSRTRRSTVLSLAALPDRAMTTLVGGSLPDASPALLATVLDRAGGSPLYAEQLAAMLRDRVLPIAGGVLDEEAIPASIAALLAARIDALPADAKAVLLDASVIGKTFWSGAVVALSGGLPADLEPALTELARRELIRPVYPSTMAGEAEYTFWHALLRDVAYGELTRGARLARHRATAAWITDRAGAAIGEDAEIVVAHLDRALELAAATGALGEVPAIQVSLVDALLASADTAMRTEVPRAVGHLRRAAELLDAGDARRSAALARLGRALNTTSDYPEAATALEEAVEALTVRGEDLAAAELGAPLAIALFNSGRSDTAEATLEACRAVLEHHPGPGLVAILSEQAVLRSNGEHADAADRAEEAIALAASLGLASTPRALVVRGGTRRATDPHRAELDLRAAIDGAVSAGDLRTAYVGFCNIAILRVVVEGPAFCLTAYDEAIAFAAAHGLATQRARAERTGALVDLGEWDEVLVESEDVSTWSLEHGDVPSALLADLATAYVRLERGEAIGSTDSLASIASDLGAPPTWLAPFVAEAAVARGDPGGAQRVLAEALAATPSGELFFPHSFVRACIRAGAPELARRALAIGYKEISDDTRAAEATVVEIDGDFGAARAGYERLVGSCHSRGAVPEEAYALAGLGRCLLALGETNEGVSRLRESRAIWDRLRATPRVAEIDGLLASAS